MALTAKISLVHVAYKGMPVFEAVSWYALMTPATIASETVRWVDVIKQKNIKVE